MNSHFSLKQFESVSLSKIEEELVKMPEVRLEHMEIVLDDFTIYLKAEIHSGFLCHLLLEYLKSSSSIYTEVYHSNIDDNYHIYIGHKTGE